MTATRIAASSDDQARPVRLQLQPAEQDEQRRQRDHRDERAEEQRIADRVQNLLVHRTSSSELWSADYPTHTPPEPVTELRGRGQAMPRRARRPARPCGGRAPCVRRDTHALRACSSDVRTPLITSVTVVLVVEYFSFRLTDLLRLGGLHGRLELGRVGALDLDPQVTVADRRRLDGRATVASGWPWRRGRGRLRSRPRPGPAEPTQPPPGRAPSAAPFGYSAALSTSRSSCSFQER